MTIRDIAKAANVSTATVSRVMNGSGGVSPQLCKRVEAVIQSHNYIPNAFARGITRGSMNTVGILCPTLIDSIQTTYLSCVEQYLRENGFTSLVICNTGRDSDKTPFLDMLLSRMVDAVIILGSSMKESEDRTSFLAAAAKVPVVVVNGCVETPGVYSIYCDEYGAIKDMILLLAEKGYRRILYVCDTNSFSGYQKLNGYRDGVNAIGMGFDPAYVLRHTVTSEFQRTAKAGAHGLVAGAIDGGLAFDAIVTADDVLAAGAIEALRESGRIPGEEVPVVGFNNGEMADLIYPKLTSIDNLPYEMCSLATMQLLGVLEGKTFPRKVVTSYKFVERESFRYG